MPKGRKKRLPKGPVSVKQFKAFAVKCQTGSSRVLSGISQSKACEIIHRAKGTRIAREAAKQARLKRRKK